MDDDEDIMLIASEEHIIDVQSQDVPIDIEVIEKPNDDGAKPETMHGITVIEEPDGINSKPGHGIEVIEEADDVRPRPEPVPALPEGKDYHLFVSCSSEDKERVWSIVADIEMRYNMKCIYAERDFQPGMEITQNIQASLQKSWKTLLMLTPNFTRSRWCEYEREFAFVASMESGLNCIIPVMLEECEVPPTLMTITYIDATQPYCDVPAKVALAISKPELVPWVSPSDIPKRYENGYRVDIVAERDALWIGRPAKYRFIVNKWHEKAIRESRIKLPMRLLKEALTLLNNRAAVQYYDFTSSQLKMCCWSFLLLPFLFIAVKLDELRQQLNLPRSDVDKQYPHYISIICACGTALACGLIFISKFCHREEVFRDVHTEMWDRVAQRCLKYDTILLFSAGNAIQAGVKNNPPTKFLACMIQAKRKDMDERHAMDEAFEEIVFHLSEVTPCMITREDLWPDAPYNRHNVRKGKSCICQQIEHLFE